MKESKKRTTALMISSEYTKRGIVQYVSWNTDDDS